ncbi:helix-turn-helix transcriptional regulator [uncultured Bacteroides sp.]|uniref:helix-turn-helix domain-containing protein n=1 Tax=uncultured Bacteroides sp. TaxID=162156 RepID=UPI002633A8DC|nr:helix-turn-helix transcriptional regulator [uncultured Bacteroides sp.]
MDDKEEIAILKNLAQNIRHYREAIGLSQEKLAEKAGLHRTYIGAIERLEKKPSLITAIKISKALQLDVSLLIGEYGKP